MSLILKVVHSKFPFLDALHLNVLHRMLPPVLRDSTMTQPPTRASSLSEYAAVR